MNRADVPSTVASVLGHPTRWAPVGSCIPVYDGHERTLQVFGVQAKDQLRLLEQLEPYRPGLEHVAGGPIVVIFLSRRSFLHG